MQPVAAGGKPPKGQDVNGVLFAITSHNYFTQAGQLFPWLSAVATAIGGYAVGTVLGSSDGSTVWFNTSANNMTNPDDPSTAAGWVSLYTYGFLTLNSLTGGTVTLNPQQAARRYIILNGSLAGNLAVVVPNTIGGRWLVINNTSGSFSVTVRTASGIGVNVPQGGFANPMEVYGDGTNIYPTVAPLGVPISQAATPLTLAERDNAGQLIAAYFLGTSAFENPAGQPINGLIGLGPDQATFRKYHTLDMQAAMNLASFAGQVTAGQVPQAAVTQYAAAILASAALTGTPTAPTPPPGTSNNQVATTAFITPGASLTSPGYYKLPGGLIVQFGGAFNSGTTITFGSTGGTTPMTILGVVCIAIAGGAVQCWLSSNPIGTSSFTANTTGGQFIFIAVGH